MKVALWRVPLVQAPEPQNGRNERRRTAWGGRRPLPRGRRFGRIARNAVAGGPDIDTANRSAETAQTARTSASRLTAYSSCQQTAASHAADACAAMSCAPSSRPAALPGSTRSRSGTSTLLQEIASAELAVDGEIEERQLSDRPAHFKPNPDRPHVFWLKRSLLTDENLCSMDIGTQYGGVHDRTSATPPPRRP
ncbi:hypothetical protein LPU83_pLPU83d_0852 (plasmid) [Rhizobium favelukesii]|uniref:Uncharacterized protein n=1 Tax=Rhizobium favelukesii TaxID=348824 RepID=W6RM69_9HYPH|nr:hypothetical protein LPU83_pLPU83d_0852 [Rhizobium favelukesii]